MDVVGETALNAIEWVSSTSFVQSIADAHYCGWCDTITIIPPAKAAVATSTMVFTTATVVAVACTLAAVSRQYNTQPLTRKRTSRYQQAMLLDDMVVATDRVLLPLHQYDLRPRNK